MFYVISYDVSNDKRRRLISKYLESYGIRVQYSVFECELNTTEIGRLLKGLKKSMDKKEDSIRIYPLCINCRRGIISIGNDKGKYYDEDFLII